MTPTRREKILNILLICGILSSLLYISTDVLLAFLYEGYSYTDQTISELSAIGAPTRLLWIIMSIIFNPLLIAFGIGVWMSSQKRSLNVTGILLSIWGLTGFLWLFFPMNMRGAIGSFSDTMHLIMAGVTVPLMMAFIVFGAIALGRGFRFYSIATIATMFIFGALVGIQAPAVATMQPTPWLGIMERICVYSPMLWILVLAVVLLGINNKWGEVPNKITL